MTYTSEDYWYNEYLRAAARLSTERSDHQTTRLKLARARDDLDAAEATNAALQQSVNELSARLDNGDKPEPLIFLPIKKYKLKPAQPTFKPGDMVRLIHSPAVLFKVMWLIDGNEYAYLERQDTFQTMNYPYVTTVLTPA